MIWRVACGMKGRFRRLSGRTILGLYVLGSYYSGLEEMIVGINWVCCVYVVEI